MSAGVSLFTGGLVYPTVIGDITVTNVTTVTMTLQPTLDISATLSQSDIQATIATDTSFAAVICECE